MRKGWKEALSAFAHRESSPGIVLIAVTILALSVKNSPLSDAYGVFLSTPVEVRFGALLIAKPLLLWINDGLMAVFFLLVGLEIKRELLRGHLSSLSRVALPGIGALGGMALPALVYAALNRHDPAAMRGWAIPTATDIAFSLGILSLLGDRVPSSLRVFLAALAILDDIGAIAIIAIFYTEGISAGSIAFALAAVVVLVLMNRAGVVRRGAYLVAGTALWVSVLKSGVHATLAGVILAFAIPLEHRGEDGRVVDVAGSLEKDLHPWVSFFILPLFAFVNAGVGLASLSPASLLAGVPLGVLLGLFLGKQAGVFGFSWLAIRAGAADLPRRATWRHLYGVSLLAGIGFTMSLFIDGLAFGDVRAFSHADRMAILLGSLLSGVAGYLVLRGKGSAPPPSREA